MSKIFSARFWMAIAFTLTACWGFANGKITGETFIPIVIIVVQSYFQRTDRKNGGEQK